MKYGNVLIARDNGLFSRAVCRILEMNDVVLGIEGCLGVVEATLRAKPECVVIDS